MTTTISAPSHTTAKAFPLKYFVLAFAFTWVFNSTGGSLLMAMLVHAFMNASTQLWKVLPEYSGGPGVMSAAEAAAATVHANLMLTVVLWVAAFAVVLVYGVRNLSRKPRQVLANAGD